MEILNFQFLHEIIENSPEEDKRTLFFNIINSLKNNPSLYQYISENWIKEMIIKVEWIEDTYEKVDIINFLLSVIYKNEFDIKDKKIKHLFYLYLKILQSGYDAGNDIIDTLSYFLDLGISLETIITECRKIYHNDVLLHLFSKWSVIDKHSVGECNEKFVSFIEQHRKMITRFDLVLHFNLITSYDYAKNILVVGDYLKKYYNYMTTCADWIFDGKYSDDYFVVENILTWKELQLFVELGTILDRCKELESKQKVDTEEELFEYLNRVAEQLKLLLKSEEIKSIRKRFFGERSFFEVALHLPNNKS